MHGGVRRVLRGAALPEPRAHRRARGEPRLHETLFSLQAAPSLQHAPRPLRADDLLPERALLGDEIAREELYCNVYRVLHGEHDDDPTFLTVSTFLRYGDRWN